MEKVDIEIAYENGESSLDLVLQFLSDQFPNKGDSFTVSDLSDLIEVMGRPVVNNCLMNIQKAGIINKKGSLKKKGCPSLYEMIVGKEIEEKPLIDASHVNGSISSLREKLQDMPIRDLSVIIREISEALENFSDDETSSIRDMKKANDKIAFLECQLKNLEGPRKKEIAILCGKVETMEAKFIAAHNEVIEAHNQISNLQKQAKADKHFIHILKTEIAFYHGAAAVKKLEKKRFGVM